MTWGRDLAQIRYGEEESILDVFKGSGKVFAVRRGVVSGWPAVRMRRLRRTEWLRRLSAETHLGPEHLIQALVVHEGGVEEGGVKEGGERGKSRVEGGGDEEGLPGMARLDLGQAVEAARRLHVLGVPALAIFPHVRAELKDERGSEADNAAGLVAGFVRAIREAVPEMGIICDVALDPYTSHGHDGVLDTSGSVDNDATIERLVSQGLMLAEAGADILAPSDMMDGRVGVLRQALESAGSPDTIILSYAAKYASSLYAPFREAIGSAGVLRGDKRSYQMSLSNSDEAMREIELDVEEGADMVMVKPGLVCLDILSRASRRFDVPVLAFQVSGEYAQIMAASERGWISGEAVMLETLLSFRRAGARAIITYFAEQAAILLRRSG